MKWDEDQRTQMKSRTDTTLTFISSLTLHISTASAVYFKPKKNVLSSTLMSSSCGSGWKVFIERGNSVVLDKKEPSNIRYVFLSAVGCKLSSDCCLKSCQTHGAVTWNAAGTTETRPQNWLFIDEIPEKWQRSTVRSPERPGGAEPPEINELIQECWSSWKCCWLQSDKQSKLWSQQTR